MKTTTRLFLGQCLLILACLLLSGAVLFYSPNAWTSDRCSPGAPLVNETDLGLPVYPGLEYVSSGPGGDMNVNSTPTLPSLGGCTFDPFDQVVMFYEQELGEWTKLEQFGNYFFFRENPGSDFNPISLEAGILVHVSVIAPFQDGRPVMVNYRYQK